MLIKIAYAICCIRINPVEMYPKQTISQKKCLMKKEDIRTTTTTTTQQNVEAKKNKEKLRERERERERNDNNNPREQSKSNDYPTTQNTISVP